jgi:hypothetical protein
MHRDEEAAAVSLFAKQSESYVQGPCMPACTAAVQRMQKGSSMPMTEAFQESITRVIRRFLRWVLVLPACVSISTAGFGAGTDNRATPPAQAVVGQDNPCAADGICNIGACKSDPDCPAVTKVAPAPLPTAIVDTTCGGKVIVQATDSALGIAAAKVAARTPNFNVAQKVKNPAFFDAHPSGALATGHAELKGYWVTMIQGNFPKTVANASGDLDDPTLLFFRKSGSNQDNWGLIGMGYSFELTEDNEPFPTKVSAIQGSIWWIHEAGYHRSPGDGGFTCAVPADVKLGPSPDPAGCNGIASGNLKTREFHLDHKHGRYWTAHVWFEPGTLRPTIALTDPWCRQSSAALAVPACAFFKRGTCTAPVVVKADVTLTGTPTDTSVSGKTGSVFVTAGGDSATHAMYGLASRERSDEPCVVTVHKEHVNDPATDTLQTKNLCGPRGATSSEIKAAFSDTSVHGTRAFVTGVRVCMNNDKSRVKGFRLRGKKIDDAGQLVALQGGVAGSGTAGGSEVTTHVVTEPYATRTNCDEKDGWMSWAECPAGEVATAAKLHFGSGSEPRSLVGIALQCRSIAKK